MGPLVALLFTGGALAFFAFRTKAFEPTPPRDNCGKVMDAIKDNGQYAGPKGEAAAQVANQYGDDICNAIDGLKEGVQAANEALRPVNKGIADAGSALDHFFGKDDAGEKFYDPEERAKQLVNAIEASIKSGAEVKFPKGDGSGGYVLFPEIVAAAGGITKISIVSSPYNNYWTPNPLDGKLQHDALYNECVKIEADLYARLIYKVCQERAAFRTTAIKDGKTVGDQDIGWAYKDGRPFADYGKGMVGVRNGTAQALVNNNGLKVAQILEMEIDEFANAFVALYVERYKRNTPYVVKRKDKPTISVKGVKGSSQTPVNPLAVAQRTSTAGLIKKA